MKIACASFLLLFIPILPASAQSSDGRWILLENGPDVGNSPVFRHDDVFFVDTRTGWVVNRASEIWKTTDGGDTWNRQVGATTVALFRSVGFADHRRGWAGTFFDPTSVLFETQDGGDTWTNITDRIAEPRPSAICGLYVISEQVAVGVGAFFGVPRFIKTTDGGASWTSLDMSAYAETLVDVYFENENIGIATGGSGKSLNGDAVTLRTKDGGLNWTEVHRTAKEEGISGQWGWKISFPTPDVGYISIEYADNKNDRPAKVLKTVNGGRSWSELYISGSTDKLGLQSVGFITEDVGWASGRGTSSVTVDGGQTWQILADYSPSTGEGQLDGNVNRIFVVCDTLAYAVGRRVYKFSGQTVDTAVEEVVPLPRSFTLDQNYPNPFSATTTIDYTLHRDVDVRIEVYTLKGRRVKRLLDERQAQGSYSVEWDGRDEAGGRLTAGTYFYLLDIGETLEMKRMVLLN